MTKWLSVAVLAVGLVTLVASGSGAGSYTVGSVQGGYGFFYEGAFVDGTRVAAVGAFFADGHGNILNGVRTVNVGYPTGAMVIHQTFSCMYSVDPVGTGTATCQFVPGHTETLSFVIISSHEVQLIGTDATAVVHGVVERQG
jgi:hypothetical protein